MGQRFAGRYELVDHLGQGGSGTVWRVWDHRAGRYVAAKLLRQRDAGSVLRFVREQSLRVQHRHVLAPVGWAAEDDDVLLTMELVRGGSLETLLADYGALPLGLALELIGQLLDALEAVHAAGIVHRDVKPANVLLEATGTGPPRVLLGDFGIAVLAGDPRLTETGLVVGTPVYAAPELLRFAAPDPRQDLYAAAVVGWRLLTGRPSGELARDDAMDGLPAAVVRWLVTLLARDPAARPPGAAAARAAMPAPGAPPWYDAGGGEIEVFDHLDDLPAGWGVDGPSVPLGAPGTQATPPPTSALPGATPPTSVLPAATPPTSVLPAATLVDEAGPAVTGRAPGGPPRVRLALAAGLLVVGVGAVAAALLTSGSDADLAPTGPPADPTGSTGTAATGGAPTDTSAGATTPGLAGTTAPAGGGAVVVVGSPCAFTDVGERRPTASGAAVCTLQGSTYIWMAVP